MKLCIDAVVPGSEEDRDCGRRPDRDPRRGAGDSAFLRRFRSRPVTGRRCSVRLVCAGTRGARDLAPTDATSEEACLERTFDTLTVMAGKRGRSAKTGRFVKQATVKKNPSTTVNESVKKKGKR